MLVPKIFFYLVTNQNQALVVLKQFICVLIFVVLYCDLYAAIWWPMIIGKDNILDIAASDLDLHCFQRFLLWDVRSKWVYDFFKDMSYRRIIICRRNGRICRNTSLGNSTCKHNTFHFHFYVLIIFECDVLPMHRKNS